MNMTNPFPHLHDDNAADDYSLVVTSTPDEKDIAKLHENLMKVVEQTLPPKKEEKELGIFIKNNAGDLVAALYATTGSSWLYIREMWVNDEHQRKGVGSKLLRGAEKEAKRRGCHSANVMTYDFLASEFYQKHGYRIFGELDNYPEPYTRYYMMKRFK